jgi:hypothetical protein
MTTTPRAPRLTSRWEATVIECPQCQNITRYPQPPRATVQDIREALRGVLSEYQAVDNTPDLLHSVMLDKVAELVQDVQIHTDERDQALAKFDRAGARADDYQARYEIAHGNFMASEDARTDMARQRDAAIDDVERLQAERGEAWRTIARMTLDAQTDPEAEPDPDLEREVPQPPAGYIYVWRPTDVVDGIVHPLASARLAWDQQHQGHTP